MKRASLYWVWMKFPPMGFRDENGELVGFDIDEAKGKSVPV